MAKALRTVAIVAGVVALSIAIPGAGTAIGVSAAQATSIASIAAVVSSAASAGAQLLTKKPPAQGSASSVTIGANQPIPYSMGRTFVGGAQELDRGYGGLIGGVKNPYRSLVRVCSSGGPHEEFESLLVDWSPVTFVAGNATGYYANFLYLDVQMGNRPESTALAGPWGDIIPDWGADYKLSGYAAYMVSLKFDKKGKVWASGVPAMGIIAKFARVYDQRQDDTYPGGEGDHRYNDEDTFTFDENVSLNAITYARGRFALDGEGDESVMVSGCGFPAGSIDWASWTAFANVCDANGWKVGGTVYDGPGISRWDNLKRICAAGGAIPVFSGGKLSVQFPSPKTALDTVTADDLADGEYVVPGMKTYAQRINTLVPKYRSEDNKWEYVQSSAVSVEAFVTVDGEPKEDEFQIDLVQDKDQAAQLGMYELYNRREKGPVILPLKPRLRAYRLTEALTLDIPELNLSGLYIITGRVESISTGIVTLTFEGETTAKHDLALALTGTAPPPPTIPAPGDNDDIIYDNGLAGNTTLLLIQNSNAVGITLTSNDTGSGAADITISNHTRRYPDGDVAITGTTLTGLDNATLYYIYYDDSTRSDTTPTFGATEIAADAILSADNPYRHYVDSITTAASGGGSTGGSGGGAPGGSGGPIP